MQYNGPTFQRPLTVPERLYPPGVLVESTLRVWAISRWRGQDELARDFLNAGYHHLNLPEGTRPMFRLHVNRGDLNLGVRLITVTFTNPFDAYALLGQVFWCGCEFIAFTLYNIYTNIDDAFPTKNHMHTLPYNFRNV